MYFMGLFHHRTVFNNPIVEELFHYIQLTAGIRSPIPSLRSLPNTFPVFL
jgi:hypothetical protein